MCRGRASARLLASRRFYWFFVKSLVMLTFLTFSFRFCFPENLLGQFFFEARSFMHVSETKSTISWNALNHLQSFSQHLNFTVSSKHAENNVVHFFSEGYIFIEDKKNIQKKNLHGCRKPIPSRTKTRPNTLGVHLESTDDQMNPHLNGPAYSDLEIKALAMVSRIRGR